MNNTMTISAGIKKSAVKDYETKLFKMYERVLKDKEKLFKDKDFQLVMIKQKYDVKNKKWINDTDENFDKVEFDDGYKCIVTFALYKNGQNYIVNNKKPVALVLSRSEAHILAGTSGEGVKRGAYIVKKENTKIDAVLVSTGIDFTTAYLISEELRKQGYDIRLVSMPSMELFLSQSKEMQDAIIPPDAKVFTIEAGSTLGWYKIASKDCAIGIDTFGASGQKEQVLQHLGFDYNTILSKILTQLKK